jgi:hypothetical protein
VTNRSGEPQKEQKQLHELVEKLCGSQVIAPADQQLLRYLAQHCYDKPKQQKTYLTELGIAQHGLKIKNWAPENSIVRVAIHRLREDLHRYFKSTGRQETHRIELPKKKKITDYIVRLVPNFELSPVEAFWEPYFIDPSPDHPISIVYTEPLFFWDAEHRTFTRFLDLNYEALNRDELTKMIISEHGSQHPALRMEASYHYQPGGEIEVRHTVYECLRQSQANRRQSKSIQMKVSREYVSNKNFVAENLIVLGNKRTSWLFKELQEEMPITVEKDSILVRGRAEPYKDDKLYAYSVLTRRPNIDDQAVVTMIGANHGRASEKVAEFVTRDERLSAAFSRIDEIKRNAPLPRKFQILFRVKILPFDNPREIHPVLWWGEQLKDLDSTRQYRAEGGRT